MMQSPRWNEGGYARGVATLTVLGLLSAARGEAGIPLGVARPPDSEERRSPAQQHDESDGLGGSALMRLPEDEREVLVLRLFHGLSCEAIARRTGQPETAVRQVQLRALRRLRMVVEGRS